MTPNFPSFNGAKIFKRDTPIVGPGNGPAERAAAEITKFCLLDFLLSIEVYI